MSKNLTSIKGVGSRIAEELRDAGFETVDDVESATVDELADVHMLGEASAKAILDDDDCSGKGRPSKLKKCEDDLFAAAREGLTYEGIARVAGVGVSTLHEWRDKYEDFSESLERARAKAERELIGDVDAEFVLERSYGYTKTEKKELEHTGEGGGPIEITFQEEVVETDWEEPES